MSLSNIMWVSNECAVGETTSSDGLENLKRMVMVDNTEKLAVNLECLKMFTFLSLRSSAGIAGVWVKWHNGGNVIKEELKRRHMGEGHPESKRSWLTYKMMRDSWEVWIEMEKKWLLSFYSFYTHWWFHQEIIQQAHLINTVSTIII